jgi:hypothetical protein
MGAIFGQFETLSSKKSTLNGDQVLIYSSGLVPLIIEQKKMIKLITFVAVYKLQ